MAMSAVLPLTVLPAACQSFETKRSGVHCRSHTIDINRVVVSGRYLHDVDYLCFECSRRVSGRVVSLLRELGGGGAHFHTDGRHQRGVRTVVTT